MCLSGTYLKNHFASLCLPAIENSQRQAGALRGFNLTAGTAKKREENSAKELPTSIFEMASRKIRKTEPSDVRPHLQASSGLYKEA